MQEQHLQQEQERFGGEQVGKKDKTHKNAKQSRTGGKIVSFFGAGRISTDKVRKWYPGRTQ